MAALCSQPQRKKVRGKGNCIPEQDLRYRWLRWNEPVKVCGVLYTRWDPTDLAPSSRHESKEVKLCAYHHGRKNLCFRLAYVQTLGTRFSLFDIPIYGISLFALNILQEKYIYNRTIISYIFPFQLSYI